MNILNIKFIKDFIRTTSDAYLKGWHERNGGNLSYRLTPTDVSEMESLFKSNTSMVKLPVEIKNLAKEYFLVTGSGKFLRHVELEPANNMGIIKINDAGDGYQILWGLNNNAVPTSELPSHLKNHSIKYDLTNGKHRVILHSHATNTIALTFVLPLNGDIFTRELWEMATECPVVFPDGIGMVKWMVPGGPEIAMATSELMKKHNVVIWAHHGVFCSEESLDLAFGLMDTVEKSAEILVKVLAMGGKKQTIHTQDFTQLAKDFNVTLNKNALNLGD